MVTKQDIQNIIRVIGKQSVKDSQFPVAKSVSGDTGVAVVQDGVNKLAKLSALLAYVEKNVDAGNIAVEVEGLKGKTLADVLAELRQGMGNSIDGTVINANNVGFLLDGWSLNEANVNAALQSLYSTVQGFITWQGGVNAKLDGATESEIKAIINS